MPYLVLFYLNIIVNNRMWISSKQNSCFPHLRFEHNKLVISINNPEVAPTTRPRTTYKKTNMNKVVELTDNELIQSFQGGNTRAFDALIDRYQEKIFNTILFMDPIFPRWQYPCFRCLDRSLSRKNLQHHFIYGKRQLFSRRFNSRNFY